jgi:hypothetical protein
MVLSAAYRCGRFSVIAFKSIVSPARFGNEGVAIPCKA